MHILALMFVMILFGSLAEQNFGYTPDRQATERFARELREGRQAECEAEDAKAVVEYLKRQPRVAPAPAVPLRLSPVAAFLAFSVCGGVALTLSCVACVALRENNYGPLGWSLCWLFHTAAAACGLLGIVLAF